MRKAVIFFVLLAAVSAAGWFALQKWRQDARAEIGTVEEQLRGVAEDKANLAKALAVVRGKYAGSRNGKESCILAATSDKTVNELAQQYLGEDLTALRREAEERLAELRKKRSDVEKSQSRRQAEIKKVQRQIEDLERKKHHIKKTRMMTAAHKRGGLFDEVSRADDKIAELQNAEAELKKGVGNEAADAEAARARLDEFYKQLEKDTTGRLSAVMDGVEARLQSKLESCKKGVPEWLMKLGLGLEK